MHAVSGRFAAILAICAGLPVVTVHLLTRARLLTIIIRSCLAMAGTFTVGFVLEWTVVRVLRESAQHGQNTASGRHLDVAVGDDEEAGEILQVLSDENAREKMISDTIRGS